MSRTSRRIPRVARLPHFIAASLVSLCCTAQAGAIVNWPAKPITLVVPFPAGGGNDNVARLFSPALGEALGQSVVIDNRPGAGGTIGAAAVAKAPADGYTLLLCSTGNLTVATALYTRLSYGIQDFVPVSHIVNTPTIWVASPEVPADSLKAFIALAKREPGKYNFASAGNGTTPHLAGAALATRNGLTMQHVPYKGTTPAYTDLAAGRVNLMMDSLISALPFVEGGRVKGLAVSTAKRVPQIPQVPTLAEQGLVDLDFTGWVGLCAPKGTPATVVTKVSQGVKQALARPEMNAAFSRQSAEPVGDGPQTFAQTIERDAVSWRGIVRASGAQMD